MDLVYLHKVGLMYRILLVLGTIVWSVANSHAQVGARGGYLAHAGGGWKNTGSNGSVRQLPGSGASAGIDYALRMKKIRLELIPELNFSQFGTSATNGLETRNHWYSLFVHLQVYPFDLKGDCDCPTFSKQGNILKKGFFLTVAPGLSYQRNALYIQPSSPTPALIDRYLAVSTGIGAGLDIGISEQLTISPLVLWRYFPHLKWADLAQQGADQEEVSLAQWQAGMRVSWRLKRR